VHVPFARRQTVSATKRRQPGVINDGIDARLKEVTSCADRCSCRHSRRDLDVGELCGVGGTLMARRDDVSALTTEIIDTSIRTAA
jgi:hypothetical protein